MQNKTTNNDTPLTSIRAILMKPGCDPEICTLPAEHDALQDAVSELLDGNFESIEFFDTGVGATLWLLVNDFAVPLGLKPNRHMPGVDSSHILFGNVVVLAVYNDSHENSGAALDIPERICKMFIEQIKLNFKACDGSEKPRSVDQIYTEELDDKSVRKFKWTETFKPENYQKRIKAGRAYLLQCGEENILEINGRYFQQTDIVTPETPLQ